MSGSGIKSYRDLIVWKEAMGLAADCYRLTADLPRTELYGMTTQVRRAAASVPANVAEGYGREQTGSYIQFLQYAQGSLKELETHLLLSVDVGLIEGCKVDAALQRADAVGRLLRALIRSLQDREKVS